MESDRGLGIMQLLMVRRNDDERAGADSVRTRPSIHLTARSATLSSSVAN